MRHQFGGEGGVVAEFALLDQLVAGVVTVAGQLMVETAFGNQAVEDVVGKAVARTVFIGEADQAAGFVVMVTEGVAQGIGASSRQTVLAVFVGGFGLDCYRRNISDDLEKGSRSSEKQKQHDYRTHATAKFEVSCGLRLVVGPRPNLRLLDPT